MENKDTYLRYFNQKKARQFSASLIRFGFMNFQSAKVIKDFDKLGALGDINNFQQNYNEIFQFTLESLNDAIKIIGCFDNYMKAILLSEGFLVNIIEGEGYEALAIAQQTRPIHLEEMTAIRDFEGDEEQGYYLAGISPQIITFDTMLELRYQELLQIPTDLIDALRSLAEKKENQPFYHYIELALSKQAIENFAAMKSFVEGKVATELENLLHRTKKNSPT